MTATKHTCPRFVHLDSVLKIAGLENKEVLLEPDELRTFFMVTGFERGKEDLLPLPLKEDSHSISKSKVRKLTPLS